KAQDYQNALLGGPWLIFGHYLRVQPRQPSFSPLNLRIHKVFAWKMEIGDRGRFARLAFIIDLSKPLVSKIKVDDHALRVEYEWLPTISYHCVRYGHLEDNCPKKKGELPPETAQPQAVGNIAKGE
ncbi:hypothetical protein S83_066474, partial [Arachis hypogaea]